MSSQGFDIVVVSNLMQKTRVEVIYECNSNR